MPTRKERQAIRQLIRNRKRSALRGVDSAEDNSTRRGDEGAGYQTTHRTALDDKLEEFDRRRDVWNPKKSIRKDMRATEAELLAGLTDEEGNTTVPEDGTSVMRIRRAQNLRDKAEDEAAKRGRDAEEDDETNKILEYLRDKFTFEKEEKPPKQKKKWWPFGRSKYNCIKGETC